MSDLIHRARRPVVRAVAGRRRAPTPHQQVALAALTLLTAATLVLLAPKPLAATGVEAARAGAQARQATEQALGQARQEDRDAPQAADSGSSPLPTAYRVSAWIGRPVLGRDGKQIGTLEDLVLDDYGRFRYVILRSKALTRDQPDDLLVVPMAHLRYSDGGEQRIVLDAAPARITEAPRFKAETLPILPLRRWETLVVAYWLPQEATAEGQATLAGDLTQLPPGKEQLFRTLDQNADSAITREEADGSKRLKEQFQRIDTYDNGRITRAEFALFETHEERTAPEKTH